MRARDYFPNHRSWWMIFVSAFHHLSILILILNMCPALEYAYFRQRPVTPGWWKTGLCRFLNQNHIVWPVYGHLTCWYICHNISPKSVKFLFLFSIGQENLGSEMSWFSLTISIRFYPRADWRMTGSYQMAYLVASESWQIFCLISLRDAQLLKQYLTKEKIW